MTRTRLAGVAVSALLLASCASSTTDTGVASSPSSTPASAKFAVVSSDWQQVSPGTADQVVHPAANCSLDAANHQTCVPQQDRVAPGSPPAYAAHAVLRNDGDGPGAALVVMGAMGTNCSVSSAPASPGQTTEVSCGIGPLSRPDVPPQVTIAAR